jgi:PAS domain S-box-containing protein
LNNREKTRELLLNELDAAHRRLEELEKRSALQLEELESLRNRESYFQSVTHHSSDIIFVVDGRGKISYANEAVERFLGYRPEEMIGRNAVKFIHPEDIGRALRDFASSKKTPGMVKQNTFRVLHGDGPHRVLEGVGANLLDDPIVRGFVMNVRDVTERKQMETALRDSEERSWILSSLSFEGICISRDHLIVDANDTFIFMTGHYSLSEIAGKNLLDMVAPDSRYASFLTDLTGGLEGSYEVNFLRNNGSAFPAEFNVRNIIYQGENARFTSVRDITERKRAGEALRESEERYRSLFENSGSAMLIVENNAIVSLVNTEFEKLSGYSREEIEGKVPFTQFVSPKDLQRMVGYHEARKSQTGDAPSEYEFRLVDREGNEKDVLVKIGMMPGTRQTIAALLDISALKKAQQRIRESLEFNKTVFAVSPVGIVIFHSSGPCVSVNNAVAEIIGGRTEQVLQQNFRQLESWRESGMLEAAERALATGQVQFLETHLTSTFGGSCWVDCRFAPFHHEGELHLLLLMADINDRILAEKALKESERRLADIIDFLPDATLVIDRKGVVIAWNRAMEELTGIDSSSMLGKGNYEHAIPVYRERRPILVDLVMHPDPGIEKTYYILERKGEALNAEGYVPSLGKFLSSTAAPLRDSEGRLVGAIQSTRDITEERRALDELAMAEEKYRGIFENSVLGIFQTTPGGRIINCNMAYARIGGYDSPEELMSSVSDTTRLYVEPEAREEFLRSLETGGEAQAEFKVRRKDGALVWLAAFARAVRDTNGEIISIEGTAQDITERKRLESQLMQSQKIEAIGTLAGGIAHDFNNLLGVIIGFTEMAKSRLADSDIDRYLENVLRSCDRAKGLITQILTFSRRAEQEKKPVDLGAITGEAVKLLRATIPTTIEIRLVIPPLLHSVLADPTQVHQVLINLCANAAHAMKDRGGALAIMIENCELAEGAAANIDLPPGPYVKLTVSDTGTGISRQYVHRIFDPFFTTKAKGEGTGLGLSVVYGIVRESGGAITVESEPGKGTTFSVYLPGIEGPSGEQKVQASPTPKGSERILFIDDEQDIADMGKEMLGMLGYDVESLTSPAMALERFREDPGRFDLVITDMTMPGMTGADLAMELLRIRAGLPIILCTGFSELISGEKAKEMGIRQFLNKPISYPDMAREVRKALDGE